MTGQAAKDPKPSRSSRRPETSPYNEPNVTVHLLHGHTLYIPAHLVRECPELEKKLKGFKNLSGFNSLSGYKNLSLDITLDVGHSLVHYLSTGHYQCLKTKESSLYKSRILDLRTGLGVYKVATLYNLPQLQDLARDEIQMLGDEIPAPVIFHIIQEIYIDSKEEDTWLSEFFKSRLRCFLEHPADPQLMQYDRSKGSSWQISDMLFKGLFELQTEQTKSRADAVGQAHNEEQDDIYSGVTPPSETTPEVLDHESNIHHGINTDYPEADHFPVTASLDQPDNEPCEERLSPFFQRAPEVVYDNVLQESLPEDDALLARPIKSKKQSKKEKKKEKKSKKVQDESPSEPTQVSTNGVTDSASFTNPGQADVTSWGSIFRNRTFDTTQF